MSYVILCTGPALRPPQSPPLDFDHLFKYYLFVWISPMLKGLWNLEKEKNVWCKMSKREDMENK